MTRRDQNEPVPLEVWIRGRVHVHFRGGHVAELQMSLRSAHSVRLQVDGDQGGERIGGLESHNGWVAARSEEIVLTEWTPEPDYGWRDTSPRDRQRLRELQMTHGILAALADLWAGRPGHHPAYSIAAVSALYHVAVGTDVSREAWDRQAELVEGKDGARVVASVWAGLLDGRFPDPRVDDAAEPEPASSASADPGDDPGRGTSRDREPGEPATERSVEAEPVTGEGESD